jgi:Cdc6-like AAA superfamily ATPase
MQYSYDARIIERPDLLSPDTLPEIIIGRTEQMAQLRQCLEPVHRNLPAISAWLYGPPGTGKTAVARQLAAAYRSGQGKVCYYVNCWERPTLYSVVQALCEQGRVLGADVQDTNVKTMGLRQLFGDQCVLIILDEIDRPIPKQRESIIYELLKLGKVGLFCIAADLRALFELTETVRSQLALRPVHFPQYTVQQTCDILSHRAQQALVPGSYTGEILETIASCAGGDARRALYLLLQAAVSADRQGADRIGLDHISCDAHGWQQLQRKAQAESLPYHQRLIYNLARGHGQISSLQLRQQYLLACHNSSIQPAAPRTFAKYIGRLIQRGMLDARYEPGIGPGRVLRAVV